MNHTHQPTETYTMKVAYTLQGVQHHAIVQPGESRVAAMVRSIGKKAGVGDVRTRATGIWLDAHMGRDPVRQVQITVLGKRSKTGGYPVMAEFYRWEPMP